MGARREGKAEHGRDTLGRDTLVQRFRFEGATAAELAELLWTGPLVGSPAIFAGKGSDGSTDEPGARSIRGFRPAPGFRFDVRMERAGDLAFVVAFTQPDRAVPYLAGGLAWSFADDGADALLDEQINTAAARALGAEPLGGPRPSLRRWLFFRVGHGAVMDAMVANLDGLRSAQ